MNTSLDTTEHDEIIAHIEELIVMMERNHACYEMEIELAHELLDEIKTHTDES